VYDLVSDPSELVALTDSVYDAAVVGVPDRTPAVESDNPVGIVPVSSVHVIGVVPVAASVCVYATPTVPPGSVAVVMTGAVAAGERLPYRALNVCPPKVFASNVCKRVMASAD
jgi:hypothetical protein